MILRQAQAAGPVQAAGSAQAARSAQAVRRPTCTARRLGAAGGLAVALGLGVIACGSEQQAPEATPSAATLAPDGSIPVVGGPSPQATSPGTRAETTPDECGMTGGPDGALHVRLAGGDVTCETAMQIAKEYSPLIATGQPQAVSGWRCAPSAELPGELARCTKDNQVIAFSAI